MRVGVMGVGHWHAPRHTAGLREAGARIVGVTADEPPAADRWAGELGCPVCGDVSDLLARARPDFVLALPRPAAGPGIAGALIASGVPFAIEKPFGLAAAEVAPLAAAAKARGAFVVVPFINRLAAFWEHYATLRADGTFGDLAHATFRIVGGPPARYLADDVPWMLDPAVSGGGALRNLGIHAADAASVVAGGPVRVVAATVRHRHGLPVEDHAIALLETASGATIIMEAGYLHPHMQANDKEWRAVGDGAYLVERGTRLDVDTRDRRDTLTVPTVTEHYARFARETFAALRDGTPPLADLTDYLAAMQLVDDIYAAAGSRQQAAGGRQ